MNVILYNVLENIFYYTPETLGILLLTHGLLQKKMRFDKTNIFYLLLSNLFFRCYDAYFMGYGSISIKTRVISYLIYPVFVYLMFIYIKFKVTLERALQAMMATYLIIFVIEILVMTAVSYITYFCLEPNTYIPHALLWTGSVVTCLTCYLIYKKCNITKIFFYIFEKNRVLGRIVEGAGVMCVVGALLYQTKGTMTDTEILLFFFFIVLFIITLYQWKKAMDLSQEKDKRILIQQMCQESYEQLILEVRNRQHEFQNHLSALQGMCYSCQTIEELSELQSQYCDRILVENKYNKLLYICKSPIIGGFLYSKFSKAEEKGIETEYQVTMDFKEEKIDEFELIEMIGILYDNAVEALEVEDEKKINVKVSKEGEQLIISVENISPFVPSEEIAAFFQQGFSTKGKGRGLGLAKLQKMVEKYKGRIVIQNVEREGNNWIAIDLFF